MEFKQGKKARKNGKSIEYNPYRHKGTAEQFTECRRGWLG